METVLTEADGGLITHIRAGMSCGPCPEEVVRNYALVQRLEVNIFTVSLGGKKMLMTWQ